MSTTHLQNLLNQGIVAFQQNNRQKARLMFEAAISQDEENVAAWWWLAQTLDNSRDKSKCLEKSRALAAQNEAGLAIYRSLLEKSQAPKLRRYKLAHNSRSLGDKCPVCTLNFAVNDFVVHCPGCQRAHHDECWMDNVFHCGNFACPGEGLVQSDSIPAHEPPDPKKTLSIRAEEIPEESPWETREEKEAGFVEKLTRRFVDQVIMSSMMEEMARDLERQERERQEEQRKRELAKKVAYGLLAGLISGIIVSYFVWQVAHNWVITIFTLYLVTEGITVSTIHGLNEDDRFINITYWLIPRFVSFFILWFVFSLNGNGILAVFLAYLGGSVIFLRIFRMPSIYRHKNLIIISIFTFICIGSIRYLVEKQAITSGKIITNIKYYMNYLLSLK